MKFYKFFTFALLSRILIHPFSIEAVEPSKRYDFRYDIEMFTFYPYHCEATLMQQMKKVFQCEMFVETGSLGGDTAFCASPIFDQVITVELSPHFFSMVQQKNVYPNVSAYQGSSDQFLDWILPQIQNKRKLFWLDAHCSGGMTTTLFDEQTHQPKSPIWGELTAICKYGLSDSVVLIDDISGYLLEMAENMRYPHLHDQYSLIKRNCETVRLYVVGDLALIYDSVHHNPSVSPIVQDCTLSRMFNSYHSNLEDEKAVLEAEYDLVKRCYESEADRICYLSGYCLCREYRLWRGLIYLGLNAFDRAAEEFRFAKNNGLTHWRVDFYLAYALAKMKAYDESQDIYLKIKSHAADHESFLNKNYPFSNHLGYTLPVYSAVNG